MTVTVCDRCGKRYEPFKKRGEFVVQNNLTNYYFEVDFCPECYNEVQKLITNFMKNKE